MRMQLDLEKLRKHSLFIATPMYGGQCSGPYCRSVSDLRGLCAQHGIPAQTYFLYNESLITRARNQICDEFLRSNCTHLMFIDSDIGFTPQDVLAMMMLSIDTPEYGILAGIYPKKTIPTEFCYTPLNRNPIHQSTAFEVSEIGTGFMMIRRETLASLKPLVGSYKAEANYGGNETSQFFQAEMVGNRYLSEDYWFCDVAKEAGIGIFSCPWVKLKHVGMHIYTGSVLD
jgi:hypothetical protein